MTVYLALDATGVTGRDLPDGEIVAINRTVAGLRTLGYTAALGYRNDRLRSIDETGADWDADCVPGWYYIHTGQTPKVLAALPKTAAQLRADQVALDIVRFQEAIAREVIDWEKILAKEAISPHVDSGHAWSNDLLHALLKPWMRVHVVRLTTAKATPTQANIDAYTADLTRFITLAETLGIESVYNNAIKAEWRPLRAGTTAYRYDTADGGILRDEHNAPTGTVAVTYPTGESVATWDALAAVDAL